MNAGERKKIRELRGDRNLRWVKGDRVGEPSFIMEVDDSLSPEEFLAQTGGSVADSICHTDAEVVVEFFNAMPELLDDVDRLEAENAALRARVEKLEEVRKAARSLAEFGWYNGDRDDQKEFQRLIADLKAALEGEVKP